MTAKISGFFTNQVKPSCSSITIGERIRNFEVEFRLTSANDIAVKVTGAKAAKSDGELLDQATNSLLNAVKKKMIKKQARVDYAKLRKDGYSDRFLAKLERA